MNQIIFKDFLNEKREWYKKIGKVYCPILNDYIIFNSKGFYHFIKNAASIFQYKKAEYSKPLGKYFEIWQLREKERIGLQKNHQLYDSFFVHSFSAS